MLNIAEAKIIAGRMLVKKYGLDFLRSNRRRIGSSVMKNDKSVDIFFTLYEKDIDTYGDLFHMKGNEHFGEIIFSASVDLDNGKAVAI